MKKRIVSFLLALVMAVSLLPVSAFAVDGAYTVAEDASVQQGDDTNTQTQIATHAGAITNIATDFTEIGTHNYKETSYKVYQYKVASTEKELTFNVGTYCKILMAEPVIGEKFTKFTPAFGTLNRSALEYIASASALYNTFTFDDSITAKLSGDTDKTAFFIVTRSAGALPKATVASIDGILIVEWEPVATLTDKQKKPLTDLLATVTGENEQNWYQSGDRYNAKTKATSEKGFWTEFTAVGGPRAQAQKVLDTATAEAEITAAVTALQAAIANLIPTTQLNPTKLYEGLKSVGWDDKYLEKNFTENSIVKFKAKLAEAKAYLDSLFDEEGIPTAENVPENQSKADDYPSAVSRTLVDIAGLGLAQEHQKTVNALLKQYPMTANNGVYTEDSWNAFVAARDAAKDYFTQYPPTEEGYSSIPGVQQYSKVTKNLLQAVYGLTPAAKRITVTLIYTDDYHLRVPDSKKTDPAGNKPSTQTVTLTSGATIGDLLSKTGYTYQSSSSSGDFEGVHYSQNKLLVNGVMLNGVVHPESYISDTSYVLRDGDVVQFIHMDWPSFEFNYIYRDAPNWIALGNKLKVMRFGGTSAQTAKTGVETTVTVEATSAHLWTYNGIYSAYAGAEIAVYGPRNEDGTYPEKAILTGKLTDAAGQASFKLYNKGVYLVTAFESHANDSNSGYYPSAVAAAPYLELTVTANEDGAGIKADLKTELDKVYKTYPESYFRPETWEKLKAAYDKAAEILTSADSSVSEAYDAQQSAISEIKGYQDATTAENEKTLTNFRTALGKLPDNTALLTAGVKSTVDELIGCYGGMSDYQRKQLTGAEKAKYDKIKAFADANETFPADKQYNLKLNVVADTPEATAALSAMMAYLRENPAKMDRAEGGKYDHTKAINIVTPYTFGRYDGRTMLFSETFSKIEPLTPVRLYTAIDYAAYFQTRNANGTFTVDGANWSISDESLGLDLVFEGTNYKPGEYGTTGHLTVTVNGVVYGIKSVTFDGIAAADVAVETQRVYDDSGYKGKSTDVVNVDIPDAYQAFTMPYNDVTVTITWAPVGDTLSTVKQAALSRLQELCSSLGDKAEAAYKDGASAIAAAKTAAAVDKAYQAAVKNMQTAAASYGTVRVIVENTTFPEADWGRETYWYGEATNTEVKMTADSTMMSCVVEALKQEGYSQTGAESNYISSITVDGFKLAEFDGGGNSGWMGTLNDWFTNYGFGEFTVANGKLQDGDVIRIMYTRDLGVDLDGTWDNSDTTLAALDIQGGKLLPRFVPGEAGNTYEYTLAIDGESADLKLTPTAANKNYLTKIFLNEKVTSDTEGVSFYKRTQTIPVAAGDTIYVGCGEVAWPSMNKQGAEAREYQGTWYVLHVVNASAGASYVDDLIDALPDASDVSYDNYQQYGDAAEVARKAYEDLDKAEQDKVNTAELERVEAAIAQFKAIDDVKAKIDALPDAGKVTLAERDAVKAAQDAYDALTAEQQDYLTFAQSAKVTALAKRIAELEAAPIKSVEELIDAIGTVTLDSKSAIDEARKAYDGLTKAQQAKVSNYAALTAAETAYAKLAADKADQDAADAVIAKIDAIGTVTLDSKSAIDEARKAYDGLTKAQQAKVSNYTALTAAETAYAKLVTDKADQDAADTVIAKIDAIGTVTLKSKKAIDAARKAYDKLTAAQQARVSNYATLTTAETAYAKLVADKADQDAADAVIAKINAIGTVTLKSKKSIDAARKAYDALTAAQQARVSNYATLTTAETTYAKLVQDKADQDAADAAIAKIDSIGVVSRAAKSRIDAARKAYDSLTTAQKALVPASVVKTLTDAETAYANLPPRHSSDDTADSTKPAQSSRTGDAGIAIYAAMSLLSVTGGAWVIGKKRKH